MNSIPIPVPILVGVLAFLGGSVFLYLAVQRWRKAQLVRNTPTETADAMAFGRTELEGTVKPMAQVVDQPFDDGDCVYAWYKIEEYRRKRRKESADGKGKKWVTLDKGEVVVPFAVNDGTGTVLIDVEDDPDIRISKENRTRARVGARETEPEPVQRFLKHNGWEASHDGVAGVIAGTRRKYSQAVLPPGEDVYVFGHAELNENDQPVMKRDEETGEFIISDQEEDDLARSISAEAAALGIVGVALFCIGFYLVLFDLPAIF